MSASTPAVRRILLKLSGEALAGDLDMGIDAGVLNQMAKDIAALVTRGIQVGLVVGGGNLYRGSALQQQGLVDRVTGDHMGMLATVMNGLALRDALEKQGVATHLFSGLAIEGVAEAFNSRAAIASLQQGKVCVFVAGTGSPFFTTDTAATLRGIEIQADLVLKATKVDGVYDSDPAKNPQAKRFSHITFDEVLDRKLAVMDLAAMCLCRDNAMPLQVFDMHKPGALLAVVMGQDEGTRVSV